MNEQMKNIRRKSMKCVWHNTFPEQNSANGTNEVIRVGDCSVIRSAYLEFINARYCLDCQEQERYKNFHDDAICYKVVEATTTTTTTAKQNEEGWE